MILAAPERGKKLSVFADETRPVLQGARLTAWELRRARVPVTVITDGMAGYFMQRGEIGAVAMIAALSVSSTIVDCSPLSTNGALVLANSVGVDREVMFRRLLAYGAVVVAVAPFLVWLAFVVPTAA